MIGVLLMIFLAPQLAKFALKFSSFEYFWLAIFGLSLSALVSAGNTLNGILSASLGMLISTVGLDIVSGAQRFTYGKNELMDGVQFIPVMIGLFGLSEVLRNLWRPSISKSSQDHLKSTKSGRIPFKSILKNLTARKRLIGQSALVGTVVGALPGAGADIAAWGAYGLAQKTSKSPEEFGTGSDEGVIAPTSANNAAVGGAWIPALVFGIPGDAVTAIVLGALMVYDIKPGPMIFEQSGPQVQSIFAIAFITQILLLPAGWIGIKTFDKLLRLPRHWVLTAVVVFSVVGAYSLQNSMFDVYVMALFGLIGFGLELLAIPLAPLILGLILGPMVEKNLRTGLIKTEGDWMPFLTRPFCLTMVTVLLVVFMLPTLSRLFRKKD
jgi:TctA family transporter